MRTLVALTILLCAGLVLAQATGTDTTAETAAPEEKAPPPHRHEPIPAEARALRNPVAADGDSVKRGETVFSSQCTMCHGVNGNGKGDLVERLKLEIPDFTDPGHRTARTDGELFHRMSAGCGSMIAQGKRMTERERWDLVNYIRTLSRAG